MRIASAIEHLQVDGERRDGSIALTRLDGTICSRQKLDAKLRELVILSKSRCFIGALLSRGVDRNSHFP